MARKQKSDGSGEIAGPEEATKRAWTPEEMGAAAPLPIPDPETAADIPLPVENRTGDPGGWHIPSGRAGEVSEGGAPDAS